MTTRRPSTRVTLQLRNLEEAGVIEDALHHYRDSQVWVANSLHASEKEKEAADRICTIIDHINGVGD